jgi:hypothetical protein
MKPKNSHTQKSKQTQTLKAGSDEATATLSIVINDPLTGTYHYLTSSEMQRYSQIMAGFYVNTNVSNNPLVRARQLQDSHQQAINKILHSTYTVVGSKLESPSKGNVK